MMRRIINEIGWPTISKVGEDASNNAWLLAQHADHDREFQKKCLELMKAEAEGEVSGANIAFLEDRLAVAEGRPQLYGTQFYGDKGNYQPETIFDTEHLDLRRKQMGLEPFDDYKQSIQEL